MTNNFGLLTQRDVWTHFIIQGDYSDGKIHTWLNKTYNGYIVDAGAWSNNIFNFGNGFRLGGAASENSGFKIGEMKWYGGVHKYTNGVDASWGAIFDG